MQALTDTSRFVREAAAEALGKIGSEQAVEALMQTLNNDEESDIRGKAAWALGQIGGDQALDGLIEALHQRSLLVRFRAAGALGELGGERAVVALTEALSDHSRQYEVARYAPSHHNRLTKSACLKQWRNRRCDTKDSQA